MHEAENGATPERHRDIRGDGGSHSTITIRPARSDEADAIAALHEASATVAFAHIFPPEVPYPREETLRRWRTFTGHVLVAEAANEDPLVGFAAFDQRELHALYVAPPYWSQGVGARLLAAAGPVRDLWVLKENTRGRRFYERHGWHPDGTEREAYGVVEMLYRRGVGPADSSA